jgi:hypothetical protein
VELAPDDPRAKLAEIKALFLGISSQQQSEEAEDRKLL